MTVRADNSRNRELAQIHCAKRDLALDEETYRAMLWTIARVKSAADLDFTGRRQVIEHLRARGFRYSPPPSPSPLKGEGRNSEWAWVDRAAPERRAMLRKIIMLLRSAEPPRARSYADAICERMWGIARLELAAPNQLHAIVAELVEDQRRRAARREQTR